MLPFRFITNAPFATRCIFFPFYRYSQHIAAIKNEETQYPPIIEMTKEGKQRHQRQLWYDSIKALPTVEEKLYELALQQRLNLKKYMLSSAAVTYSAVPFQSYITRTHIIQGLPENIIRMDVNKELEEIRATLCDTLYKNYFSSWKRNSANRISSNLVGKGAGAELVNALIMQCYKKLASRNDYILQSTVQRKPRLSSFWWHSGFESKLNLLHNRNLCFQYSDFPSFMVRMKRPLSPVIDMNDPLCASADVEDCNYHPKVFGISCGTKCITSTPGYWPGDPCEYPMLLVFSRGKMQPLLQKVERCDLKKIEDGFGVMSSFGCLNAVATYQGFSPFHDVTYPFVIQTILTNGQDWNFFVYQLNTISFHSDVDRGDRRNLCWSSGRMQLFETIEDGQLKGINDEVFKMLLRFLLNAPRPTEGVELKPYLGEDVRGEEEAKFMRFFFRRMYSFAPNPLAHQEEIPTWRRIYKLHKDAPPCPFIRDN